MLGKDLSALPSIAQQGLLPRHMTNAQLTLTLVALHSSPFFRISSAQLWQ